MCLIWGANNILPFSIFQLCQLNNVVLNNLSGLDLVRRSRSHVKDHRRGSVCVLRMLLVSYIMAPIEVIRVSDIDVFP